MAFNGPAGAPRSPAGRAGGDDYSRPDRPRRAQVSSSLNVRARRAGAARREVNGPGTGPKHALTAPKGGLRWGRRSLARAAATPLARSTTAVKEDRGPWPTT